MESKQEENGKTDNPEVQTDIKKVSESPVKSAESQEPYDPGEKIDETVLEGIVVKSTDTKPQEKETAPAKPVIAEPKMEIKSKRFDRSRKKNEKNYELFLKSLQGLSLQDQTAALVKKTNDMMEEIRTLSSSSKLYKTKSTILEKEKEQLQSEQNKNLIARTRLENICRELQRQNKQIKEETAAKIREEEEKRKEVTTKFQSTLNDVSRMMEQNSSENIKLRDDNIQISERFKKLCEEFKAREEDIQRISKQLSLEKKLSEANLARCQLELEAEKCEKEVWLKEKEDILRKLHDATKDKLILEVNMKNMEEHLAKYSDKYQKFESTITKSNEIFESYKVELASMSNQVSKLESDCLVWKDRWVQTSQSVNRLIAVNQSLEHDLKVSDKKLEQLTNLCRFLQTERTRYLKQLKTNNIEPEPSTSTLSESDKNESDSTNDTTNKILANIANPTIRHSEKSSPKSSHALTAKERELQTLRDEIVKLQSEISKAVEKEVEEKLKSKQQSEAESLKNKRRAKAKKGKKNGKGEEKSKSPPESVAKKPDTENDSSKTVPNAPVPEPPKKEELKDDVKLNTTSDICPEKTAENGQSVDIKTESVVEGVSQEIITNGESVKLVEENKIDATEAPVSKPEESPKSEEPKSEEKKEETLLKEETQVSSVETNKASPKKSPKSPKKSAQNDAKVKNTEKNNVSQS